MLREVKTDQKCDMCGARAKYYDTTWYIHVCSTECLVLFERKYDEEIGNMTREKLEGLL